MGFIWFSWLLLIVTACEFENPLAVPTLTPIPPTATAEPTPVPPPEPDTVAGFVSFIAEAEQSDVGERQSMVNRFTAQLSKSPIVDKNEVVYLLRSGGVTAQLVGDMNNWRLEDAPHLIHLEGTDLWYLVASYEPEARLDYQFVLNGNEWMLDPLNPRTIMSGYGPNSELVMSAYETPLELQPSQVEIPSGILTSHTIDSANLNQARTFVVYAPAGQLIGEKLPSIYIQDGGDYLNLIDTATVLDRLIAQRQIPPIVAVFIPPISRPQEYVLNDAYTSFMADELVPFVRATYATDPDPARTGTLGSSLGGVAALYAAISRPDVFKLAAGQSGAYSVNGNALIRQLQARQQGLEAGDLARGQTRIYLVVGAYETAVAIDGDGADLLAANRRLEESLSELNITHQLDERPEGHSWGLWRGTLGRALDYLLSP